MTPSRSTDLFLLLAGALPASACVSTVADSDDGDANDKGANDDAIDAAVDACGPYATKAQDCYAAESPEYGYSYLTSLGYCIAYLGYADVAGVECRAAMEDHFACLAQLDCEDLLRDDIVDGGDEGGATMGEPPPPLPCEEERSKVDELCEIE
jgi:hypothetical protein